MFVCPTVPGVAAALPGEPMRAHMVVVVRAGHVAAHILVVMVLMAVVVVVVVVPVPVVLAAAEAADFRVPGAVAVQEVIQRPPLPLTVLRSLQVGLTRCRSHRGGRL
jgi:hypothetical protein